MKKLFTLIAFLGLFVFVGCDDNDPEPIDNDTISEVFEIKGVNFDYNTTDGYTIYRKLTPNIVASDVILIYRLAGTIDANTPIWQQIPRTLFLPEGELDYDFDFSKEDFTIYAGGNYKLNTTPAYITNQTFRIVIVPGSFSKSVDTNNFSAVMKALNVKENQIQDLQM